MIARGLAAGFVVAFGIACGNSSSPTSPSSEPPTRTLTAVAQTPDWPASTPQAEGMNPDRLGDLALNIRRGDFGRISSLMVARNGRLVVEEYFNGMAGDRTHTMQSVSKSVTSLLVGIAIQRGTMRVDDPVSRFFPRYQPFANDDSRKSAVRVRDLLTMRSGLDWNEDIYAGSPLQRMNECFCDWLRFVLDWPMREPPGSRWQYISGATIVLGGIVGAATGQRLDQFANAELFGPLGFAGASWHQGQPDGLPHAGGGLLIRPRDMAKIGQLVADGGQWQGRQIVSESWLRDSTQRISRGVRNFGGHSFDYGYKWWLTDEGGDIVTAIGAMGQWLFVSRERRLVVSVTASEDSVRPINIFFSGVLPAVQ